MKQLLLVLVGIAVGLLLASFMVKKPAVYTAHFSELKTNNVDDTWSLYIPGDIAHINDTQLEVTFEVADTCYSFKSEDDMYEYIEELSAYTSSTIGYADDLDYNIRNGYVYAITTSGEEPKTDLIYQGPNWTVNGNRDTTYIISTFNHVEIIYNPQTKITQYEHYTVN